MLRPFEFAAHWVVTISRSGKWPGWQWFDRLRGSAALDEGSTGLIMAPFPWSLFAFVPQALSVLALPSIIFRAVSYRLWRRTDWDVLVFRGAEVRTPRQAVLVRHCPTRDHATQGAEQIWTHLTEHDAVPDRITDAGLACD